MIQILAHRGWWLEPGEKNAKSAFRRALEAGYGIETDIRDLKGELVISHDMPLGTVITADEFFEMCANAVRRPMLALNIKSDGLQRNVSAALKEYGIKNYFVFDMSVPDTLEYLRLGLTTFTRRSDYEGGSPLDDKADGLWLDSFSNPFVEPEMIVSGLEAGKAIAIVSPELHGKPHLQAWELWRSALRKRTQEVALGRVHICSDFPDQAADFFSTLGEE